MCKEILLCRTEEQNHAFEKEAGVMACLNHPNVLGVHLLSRTKQAGKIVLEYMPKNLQQFINQCELL
jgi:hypothetical protein